MSAPGGLESGDVPLLLPRAPLRSAHLRVRRMTVNDVSSVVAIRARPEVHAYLSHGPLGAQQLEARMRLRVARMAVTATREANAAFVVEAREAQPEAARREATGPVIGDCGYRLTRAWTQGDAPSEHLVARIHYALSPDVAGRGFGTELVGVLVDHLFAAPGVHRIQADVFADHAASRRVLEKNGFRQEGCFVDDGIIDGRFVDACVYSLLRREWA